MKVSAIFFVTVSVLSAAVYGISEEPAGQGKDEAAQTAVTAPSANGETPKTPVPGSEGGKTVNVPDMVVPKVPIPRVIIEYPDEVTGKYPSEMSPSERVDYDKRIKAVARPMEGMGASGREKATNKDKANTTVAVPTEVKTDEVEFVSVDENDPENRKVVVKKGDGTIISLDAPKHIVLTKTVELSALGKGEKMKITYMVTGDKNRLISASNRILPRQR